jgi:hypothetical protein
MQYTVTETARRGLRIATGQNDAIQIFLTFKRLGVRPNVRHLPPTMWKSLGIDFKLRSTRR